MRNPIHNPNGKQKSGEIMIVAIGIDIIEIERIKLAMERSPHFLDRIMTAEEKEQIVQKGMRTSTVAGIFAGKEAVSKVLGTGIGKISWHDIQILTNHKGAPTVVLQGQALLMAQELGIDEVLISIAHDQGKATASALGQKRQIQKG